MCTYKYNNGLCPGGRRPRLYLVKGNAILKFKGSSIPGFCAIATAKYEKNGKWCSTTYQLELAPGVRALYFLSPMHGTWGDTKSSWGEIAQELGLSIESAKALISEEYPKTAERLNKLEEFSIQMENSGAQTETVIISFGSPTNRAIQEGYWEQPKSARTSDGTTVTVKPGPRRDWYNPEIVEPEGAKIISSVHSPGMHGGYWTIEVLVPVEVA